MNTCRTCLWYYTASSSWKPKGCYVAGVAQGVDEEALDQGCENWAMLFGDQHMLLVVDIDDVEVVE